jgi:hypothetical protein
VHSRVEAEWMANVERRAVKDARRAPAAP